MFHGRHNLSACYWDHLAQKCCFMNAQDGSKPDILSEEENKMTVDTEILKMTKIFTMFTIDETVMTSIFDQDSSTTDKNVLSIYMNNYYFKQLQC